jgi:hypothetical protein
MLEFLLRLLSDLQVDPRYFSMLAQWRREYTMENILTELKKEMASPPNRKLQQPAEAAHSKYFQLGFYLNRNNTSGCWVRFGSSAAEEMNFRL